MVKEMRSIQKNDTDIHLQMPVTDESSSPQKAKDGFYSSCGQAFIRIR
ncbi:MAG: hypothetical protein RBT65_07295 [Methanolobus sp.]|nr:hypothetical protein [Methanolobus sp.]